MAVSDLSNDGEQIRLIIWDLDETFWQGTLTEGGVRYNQAAHAAVVGLAERGIVSAICSKNDIEPVRALLIERGIWNYFVFPSINWEAKGPRVQSIVEAAQLRPATVLLIDDNPGNLHEAEHFVPGLQIAPETLVPDLLGHPRIKGKDDRQLSRLNQYKLLEQRHKGMAASTDASEFLRSSNIRVSIIHDVSEHLDRVIELINRTNQLNFTKLRLPEDPDTARAELRAYITGFRHHVGLVRVADSFGDHGFVGFYSFDSMFNRLEHYCFSCRTLGMKVEAWLYNRLGRPSITVRGEVLTDLEAETDSIDWIRYVDDATEGGPAVQPRFDRVMLRGGCDLTAVGHYLTLISREVLGEYNVISGNHNYRLDHSVFLDLGFEPPDANGLFAAASVGYDAQKLQSGFAEKLNTADFVLMSFWTDAYHQLYRHRGTGLCVSMMFGGVPLWRDLCQLSLEERDAVTTDPVKRAWLNTLAEQFECIGYTTRERYQRTLNLALARIDPAVPVVITLGLETYGENLQHRLNRMVALNTWTRAVAGDHANVKLLDMNLLVSEPSDRRDPLHFDRRIYFAMYEEAVRLAEAAVTGAVKAPATELLGADSILM